MSANQTHIKNCKGKNIWIKILVIGMILNFVFIIYAIYSLYDV